MAKEETEDVRVKAGVISPLEQSFSSIWMFYFSLLLVCTATKSNGITLPLSRQIIAWACPKKQTIEK
jgi:hypothetical protein